MFNSKAKLIEEGGDDVIATKEWSIWFFSWEMNSLLFMKEWNKTGISGEIF